MRKILLLASVSLLFAACSDQAGPTNPLQDTPVVQMSHVDPGSGVESLCDGFSPCDAFAYDRDGTGPSEVTGVPGLCFLSPTVENHLSDPACSGNFIPGLSDIFEIVACRVSYDGIAGAARGTSAPVFVLDESLSPICKSFGSLQQDGSGGEFYRTNVQFKRNETDNEDIWRLFVEREGRHWAHRDVIIDPNLTAPADGYVHAIGYGNEPLKLRISEALESCVRFDSEGGVGATCLIVGETEVSFTTDEMSTTIEFPNGNPSFLADFEVSKCLALGFFPGGLGRALVDVPLGGCKISISTDNREISEGGLTVPASLFLDLTDPTWVGADPGTPGGLYPEAKVNVIQTDELGTAVLPRSDDLYLDLGPVTNNSPGGIIISWLKHSLKRVGAFLGPEPVRAYPGASWDFTRMSDFQIALMPGMIPGSSMSGTDCSAGEKNCLDLGVFSEGDTETVTVTVQAPSGLTGNPPIPVPGARLHFFPSNGTLSCGGGLCPTSDVLTTPAGSSLTSNWGHVVVTTDDNGEASVDWTFAGGENVLEVAGCGIARPGTNEPQPSDNNDDGVYGALGGNSITINVEGEDITQRVNCQTRRADGGITTEYGTVPNDYFDNGPRDGFSPFEPVDLWSPGAPGSEVAIYDLPLTFKAETCPAIRADGQKGVDEWIEGCATPFTFTAPLKGKKVEDNATLWTYSDGEFLYLGIEVDTNELGNRIFIQLLDGADEPDQGEDVGDDVLVLDFDDETVPNDWYLTNACLNNNASNLCGEPDTSGGADILDIAAHPTGADGMAFYEVKRAIRDTPDDPDEDLVATSGQWIGLRLTVTQGQGGGKGGFTFPDPQRSDDLFYRFQIR